MLRETENLVRPQLSHNPPEIINVFESCHMKITKDSIDTVSRLLKQVKRMWGLNFIQKKLAFYALDRGF